MTIIQATGRLAARAPHDPLYVVEQDGHPVAVVDLELARRLHPEGVLVPGTYVWPGDAVENSGAK